MKMLQVDRLQPRQPQQATEDRELVGGVPCRQSTTRWRQHQGNERGMGNQCNHSYGIFDLLLL